MEPDELEDLMDAQTPENEALAALAESLTPASTFKRRDDPAAPIYPRGLVLDLALRTAPVHELLQAYRLTAEEFKALVANPVFRRDMLDMREKLREEGYSFKVKAQAQAEAYLQQAWHMIHDPETPANVRADLIKATVKWAALEPKADAQNNVAVNVDLRGLTNEDLNARVMHIIAKRATNASAS